MIAALIITGVFEPDRHSPSPSPAITPPQAEFKPVEQFLKGVDAVTSCPGVWSEEETRRGNAWASMDKRLTGKEAPRDNPHRR